MHNLYPSRLIPAKNVYHEPSQVDALAAFPGKKRRASPFHHDSAVWSTPKLISQLQIMHIIIWCTFSRNVKYTARLSPNGKWYVVFKQQQKIPTSFVRILPNA